MKIFFGFQLSSIDLINLPNTFNENKRFQRYKSDESDEMTIYSVFVAVIHHILYFNYMNRAEENSIKMLVGMFFYYLFLENIDQCVSDQKFNIHMDVSIERDHLLTTDWKFGFKRLESKILFE